MRRCAQAWLARTEQRLELIGFAQLMLSVVRFWPQQGESGRQAGEPPSLTDVPFSTMLPPAI